MIEVALRPYQVDARDKLRSAMEAGKRRVILVAPTAFGKTETAIDLILRAIEKGRRVWFMVDRKTLCEQTRKRFAQYGIDAGIMQADNPGYAPEKPVQIWTVQTFERRQVGRSEEPDLIFVDEAHDQRRELVAYIEKLERARAIGLTATPFSAGMAHNWDDVVNGATVNQLLAQGFLSPLRMKACVTPDMTGAKKKFTGEYDEEDAGSRGTTIIGDVVQTWVQQTEKFFGGPVKTIVFSPTVKHGEEICRQFAEAGFNFQQISHLDDDKSRSANISEFEKPDSAIHGLVSCAVLTKGFDIPDVKCGISCRPYAKSFSSHIQEMGRVMRIAPGKEFGLWLCHSGNCITFADETAWLFEHGVSDLSKAQMRDSIAREAQEKVKRERFCGDCGMQMEPGSPTCHACGWERPARGEIQVEQGELIDFEVSMKSAFQPRPGLHAECLKNPRAIWNAALAYCFAHGRSGPEKSRKWAYGIWAGVYPNNKLPYGLYDAACQSETVKPDEWSLIEREVKRFRKKNNTRRAA